MNTCKDKNVEEKQKQNSDKEYKKEYSTYAGVYDSICIVFFTCLAFDIWNMVFLKKFYNYHRLKLIGI